MLAKFVIHTLEEAIKEVVGNMEYHAFTIILLVVHKVEGEGGVVPGLPKGLQGLLLILGIDDKGLEIEEAEALRNGRQKILPGLLLLTTSI